VDGYPGLVPLSRPINRGAPCLSLQIRKTRHTKKSAARPAPTAMPAMAPVERPVLPVGATTGAETTGAETPTTV